MSRPFKIVIWFHKTIQRVFWKETNSVERTTYCLIIDMFGHSSIIDDMISTSFIIDDMISTRKFTTF